ncbi:uncharacterized protein LOC143202559 [Rhynchophorus ferrugineus]|uniref:Ubiquitin-like protease family profile domain-containing protein n=1 Tax=Rhynchophorus ferrugineus TaxID=354439 RepID=A0A834HPQ0_RHYFE|nr:hypothetical protein GWI33_020388 [Rhynchophorus ferrugineus]
MDQHFKTVLEFIRNFFAVDNERSRKRRAAPDTDFLTSPKVSRYSPEAPKTRFIPIERENRDSDKWNLTSRSYKKSPDIYQRSYRTPMKSLKVVDTVTLDDDDDILEVKKPIGLKIEGRTKVTHTSTPSDQKLGSYVNGNSLRNGDEDVIFVNSFKTPEQKKDEAKLAGFSYFKPNSVKDASVSLFNIGSGSLHNGARPKDRSRASTTRNSQDNSFLNYSYRLEDKLKYKKLLEQVSNSSQSSSVYLTPEGKFYGSFGNDRKQRVPSTEGSFGKPKETTKERLLKVLDSLENEAVVVKDSDSEESIIMVSPPSPKPDIKVEPINSFKRIVDTSKFARKDWLDELLERHKQKAELRQKEIDNLREYSKKQEEINKDINIELLRRKVNDCLQLKEAILPIIEFEPETELPPLDEDQNHIVERAFRGDPNEVLARKFNLNITRRDLITLAGLNWLNDEVINFYMNLIIDRAKDSKWPRSYAFNTFFYPKLIKDGPQSLRRWTKRVDLFSYDIVCVPIHLGMHWCMAIIDFREKSIRYYDSMGSPNNKCLDALRNYLEAEHLDKKGSVYDTSDIILENMENIPQQMNGSDCGMFSCTFAEYLTRNAKITFKQDDMPYLRKKMVVEIISGELLIK